MSALRSLDIKCDAPGCLEWTDGDGSNRIGFARQAAHKAGWVTRNHKDYCAAYHREGPFKTVEKGEADHE